MGCSGRSDNYTFSFVVFFLSFFLYLSSVAPDIIPSANGGEFIAAGDTLGIPHPTGYPVWTNMSHGFSRFLPFGNKAFRVNVMCALIGSLTLVLMFLFVKLLAGNSWIALPIPAAFAVEPLFWVQSISSEVYGFHMLLSTAFVLALLVNRLNNDSRYFYLAVFVLSLALSNHLISLFYIPLLLTARLNLPKHFTQRLKTAGLGLVLFSIALSSYMYLPLRASVNPGILWHNPSNYERFFRHLSGRQFQYLMGDMSHDFVRSRLLAIPAAFQSPVQYVFWLLGAMCLVAIFFRTKRQMDKIAGGLFIAGIILFPLTYAIHDIDSYFLPFLWVLYSSSFFILRLKPVSEFKPAVFGCTAVLLILLTGTGNAQTELRFFRSSLLRRYGQAMMMAMPNSAGVFYYQGDNAMNSIVCLAGIERFRDELVYVDMNHNLRPLNMHQHSTSGLPTGRSFRMPGQYEAYRAAGMAYIGRDIPFHSRLIGEYADRLIRPDWNAVSKWNPYYNELKNQILLNFAEYEFEYGSFDQGLTYLQMAFEYAPTPDIQRFIASIASARGQLRLSIAMCNKILATNSNDPHTLHNLAYYHYITGYQLPVAAAFSTRALELIPDNTQFAENYYRILLALGDFNAVEKLETALLVTPDRSLVFQRNILLQLTQTAHPDFLSLESAESLDNLLSRLPMPALQQYYRQVLIHKIRLGNATTGDIEHFRDLSIALGYANAALSVLSEYRHLYSMDSLDEIIMALHKKCFNFAFSGSTLST